MSLISTNAESKSQGDAASRREPSYATALLQALSYLLIETVIVVSSSLIFYHVGGPPWRLEGGAPWHVTVIRISVWVNICHGLSTLMNGALFRDFKLLKYRIAWVACWSACCILQCIIISMREALVPWQAKVAVVAVANVAIITTHMWPFVACGRDVALKSVRLHMEDKLLWALHAWLLKASSNRFDHIPRGAQLFNIIWPQALFQLLAWADAMHSAPFQSWGLYMMANHASHALTINMVWKAQVLGEAHAVVAFLLFFALSSAVYSPRTSLPNLAAEKTTRIW
jgi:hypothetical protein